jgi:hypothetical protein
MNVALGHIGDPVGLFCGSPGSLLGGGRERVDDLLAAGFVLSPFRLQDRVGYVDAAAAVAGGARGHRAGGQGGVPEGVAGDPGA